MLNSSKTKLLTLSYPSKHNQINYLKAYTFAKTNNITFAILCTLPPEEKFTVFVIGPYGSSGCKGVKALAPPPNK